MKVLLVGPEAAPFEDALRAYLTTSWEVVAIPEYWALDARASDFATADVLISFRFDEDLPSMPALKLLQVPAAGVNAIRFDAVPVHVPICNAYGHEVGVAEYNMLAMLACAHDVFRVHQQFVQGRWYWSGVPGYPRRSEIHGKVVCIVGLGRIGIETARRARAFGMRVIGCNRTTDRAIPEVDELADLGSLARLVPRADFVILCCALTAATRHIVNASVLAAMKPTAFLINVGRGPLVEEQALFDALRKRRIAGAVLDVWYRYPDESDLHPRPSALPFHELDNVIMTPHSSGRTDGLIQRRWSTIAANLDNFSAGKPLINLVGHGRKTAG